MGGLRDGGLRGGRFEGWGLRVGGLRVGGLRGGRFEGWEV